MKRIPIALGSSMIAFPCSQRTTEDAVTELKMGMLETKCLIIRSKLCIIIVMRSKTGIATEDLTYGEL